MVQTPDGNIYAATGPGGQLFEIKPDGAAIEQAVLTTKENNLLEHDFRREPDTLYIGSDPNGLVHRFNRKTHDLFVVYDAGESEIEGASRWTARGICMLGRHSRAISLRRRRITPSRMILVGPSRGGGGGTPIQAEPPANPKPPAVPNPNPGEPNPIPDTPKKMMVMADDPADPGRSGNSRRRREHSGQSDSAESARFSERGQAANAKTLARPHQPTPLLRSPRQRGMRFTKSTPTDS